jgi:hypothetical protein
MQSELTVQFLFATLDPLQPLFQIAALRTHLQAKGE